MAGIKLANGTPASAEMTVDTNGNAHVVTPTTISQSGFAAAASEQDDGTVIGTRRLKAMEVTEDFRLRVGMDSVLFHHSFEGTNIARDRIQQNDTTATSAQTNQALTINSGLSVTNGQGSNIRTYRTFPLFGSYSTYGEIWAAHGNPTATNAVSEWGFGYCSGVTVQLTDGIFFRLTGGGTLRAVVANSSVDVLAEDITTTNIPSRDGSGSFDLTETNHYVIQVHNNSALFWINNVLVKELKCVSTVGSMTSASEQPLFARSYIPAGPNASTARTLILRFLNVSQGEAATNKPWSHQVAGSGQGAYQIQPGTASGPNVTRGAGTLGWPTSATARAAGTFTATTAPALASLGGMYLTPAMSTLATDVDYPVFSYQNPAGSATLPGKTLYITGVRVGESCAVAAASTNSMILMHIIGVGSTSSATTATEAATVVAARGVVVGSHGFGASDAAGTMKQGYFVDFSNGPLVVPPGLFISFILRTFGTVTSNTLTVSGSVAFIGYYE